MARPFGFLGSREKKDDEVETERDFDLGLAQKQITKASTDYGFEQDLEVKKKEVNFEGRLQIVLKNKPGDDLPSQLRLEQITEVQLLWPNGNLLYEGNLLDGQPDGEGKFYSEDGILRYEGSFIRGVMEGRGKFYRADGSLSYQGETFRGKRQGDGRTYRADGSIEFQGEFANDRYALGRYYYPGGQLQYQGEFDEDGLFSGRGRLLSEEGRLVYEGGFFEGKYTGKGTLYSPDGHITYEGDFAENEYAGYGSHYDELGNLVYQGQFFSGKYDGEGILYDSDGLIVYQGMFYAGKRKDESAKKQNEEESTVDATEEAPEVPDNEGIEADQAEEDNQE